MEFLSAGVFTEELRSGESAILGVSTSTFATVGWFQRGIENKAIYVSSLQDFFRKFGGYWKNSDAPLAVTAFFKNAGARAYLVRVTPDDAVAAGVTTPGSEFLIKAISKGVWGNNVRVLLQGNANYYNHATATYSKFDLFIQEESADGEGDFSTVETFEAIVLDDEDDPDYFPLVVNDEINGSSEIIATEVSGGIPTAFNSSQVSNETVGTGTGSQQAFTHTMAQVPVAPFTLKVSVNGVQVASDDGRGRVTMDSGVSGYTNVSGTIGYTNGALAISFTPAVPGSELISADYYKKGSDSVSYDLTGGLDGTSVSRSQVSDPALEATNSGLYALNTVDEILNIGLADFPGNTTVHNDLIAYCENRGDCFAILDTSRGMDAQDAKNYKQVSLASLSEYAAMYWPGIKVANPLMNGKLKTISNVGHVAGVYARTDSTRNVAKAPAGVTEGRLNFCEALEYGLNKPLSQENNLIYPVGVNPLVSSPQTGKAVWGCRTLSIAGDFTLVGDRRLFMFLEKSVFNSTHDLVFEPIGEDLFGIVKLRLESFMNRLTGESYFASKIPAEAYRVTIDGTNNTQATINARQLITDIEVATQKPAEFVRFRFKRALQTLG